MESNFRIIENYNILVSGYLITWLPVYLALWLRGYSAVGFSGY